MGGGPVPWTTTQLPGIPPPCGVRRSSDLPRHLGAGVAVRKLQRVAQKSPIGFGILAVENRMGPGNHGPFAFLVSAITAYAVAASLMNLPASEAGSRCLLSDVAVHIPVA